MDTKDTPKNDDRNTAGEITPTEWAMIVAMREKPSTPPADVGGEEEDELINKILTLLGVDFADWSTSLSGIYAAIRSNMQIGEPQMSKIEDWTDAEQISEDTLTAVMFKLAQERDDLKAQVAALQRLLSQVPPSIFLSDATPPPAPVDNELLAAAKPFADTWDKWLDSDAYTSNEEPFTDWLPAICDSELLQADWQRLATATSQPAPVVNELLAAVEAFTRVTAVWTRSNGTQTLQESSLYTERQWVDSFEKMFDAMQDAKAAAIKASGE